MGFFWALLSVGLVSAAQLLLRSAMVALPPLTDIVAFLQHLLHFLSYILVWAAAIWLPGWHEPFYWQSLLGVAIIVAGVLTIFWPVKRR